jgi:hypothetical protein
MTIPYSKTFSKRGILIGVCLLTAEYIAYTLFYLYANPDLWENQMPHKYILYITLTMGTVVAFIVVNKEDMQKELADSINNFSDFTTNILLGLGLSVFCTGTFILHYIIKARLFNSAVISAFIDNNLYVYSASSWLNAINHILYSILVTFIFQGFLLNGLTKEIGFKKSNVVTSLFYGFWFGDILGGTIYNLFLNQIYWKTKNIFYPGLVTVIMSIVFIMAYLIKEEIWLLKADFPDYNGEIIKGLLITIVVAPIAIKVVGQAIKSE